MGAANVPTGSMLSRLYIAQMDCPTEEALIRKKLGRMTEVQGLEFNLMRRVLTVVHRIEALPAVEDAIRDLGLGISRPSDVADTTPDVQPLGKPWWPLALAGVAALGAEVTHWVGLPEWIAAALALAAIAIRGIGTYHKGWIALRHGNLNINALMSIAVTGAVRLRQWPEAAMLMLLSILAEVIEAKSLDRVRNAIRCLVQLAPELATVQQPDGSWVELPAKAVVIGQVVRIKPGERVAQDGVVTTGQSSVN